MKKDFNIYREEGKFAAWPANFNTLCWGNEIVTGFLRAEHFNCPGHTFNRELPWEICLARSYDNGNTWAIEKTPFYDPAPSHKERRPELLRDFEGNIDFTDPNFMLMFNMSGHSAADDYSWWFYSMDKGHTWDGPFRVPAIPQVPYSLSMRTQYIPLSKDEMLIFSTCQKSNDREGRVFCAKMSQGGKKFEFVGWVGEELPGYGFHIMPQAKRREDGTIVCIIRTKEDGPNETEIFYLSQYESTDNGKTWERKENPNEGTGSNPPALTVMGDGTWVLIYGSREKPYGIRCRYSEDEGRTWSEEIVLRTGYMSKDLGYPRATTRADGSVFVAYYYSWVKDQMRMIEGTVFDKEFLLTGKLD